MPPEYIFNVGLGDLFVIRTAGEVIDRSILATIEYGAEHLHIPLLVVMGHESCGAVKAAAESKSASPSPNLDYLLKAIRSRESRRRRNGTRSRRWCWPTSTSRITATIAAMVLAVTTRLSHAIYAARSTSSSTTVSAAPDATL